MYQKNAGFDKTQILDSKKIKSKIKENLKLFSMGFSAVAVFQNRNPSFIPLYQAAYVFLVSEYN